jgi:hypothetical protein
MMSMCRWGRRARGADRHAGAVIRIPSAARSFQSPASHIDGAASILMGISANESMRTGQMVRVDDLFALPSSAK